MPLSSSPVGVFDSGVGGLSVLQALRAELPHERFVYLADSAYAPYGERGDAFVTARSQAITDYLCQTHHIKALVIACNTATAAAIDVLRTQHPALPLVGMEPALKPAVAQSQTKRIGVMGTRGTLGSARFGRLLASLQGQAEFVVQPCDGLAHAIERSTLHSPPDDATQTETHALCAQYTQAMGAFGPQTGAMDTLVLGCTHYLFAQEELRALLGPHIRLIATGDPVARQTRRLLQAAGTLAPPEAIAAPHTAVQLYTTGTLAALQTAAARWLQLPTSCCQAIALPHH
ncbi:glutamate racemase [Giesbergeria anulus]|uniref:Glutamate racemase n=1 Tax=Giesbergeria anulus TaxID=180197 RepID=A0A1H9HRK1_9BURK|nr:glutamate racemase [Giesbergeria anulus]SEQ64951.1 glutamate racemase [Giesbergeria anulus]